MIEFNPRPPKAWWDRMFRHIKKEYSRRTGKHGKVTSKRRLSQITAGVWWSLPAKTRSRLTTYYDRRAAANPMMPPSTPYFFRTNPSAAFYPITFRGLPWAMNPVGAEEVRALARDVDRDLGGDRQSPYTAQDVLYYLQRRYGVKFVEQLSRRELIFITRHLNETRGWMGTKFNPYGGN